MTLFAVALAEEATHFPAGVRVCLTGPGKLRSGIAVARALVDKPEDLVVNVGTAGALRDGLGAGAHRIGLVIEHDFDAASIEAITGRRYGNAIRLGEGLKLATGDAFIADVAKRAALAQHADLVDMEGFAVAHAALAFGARCQMFKVVTDSADDQAWSWADTVDAAAREIGRLVSELA